MALFKLRYSKDFFLKFHAGVGCETDKINTKKSIFVSGLDVLTSSH